MAAEPTLKASDKQGISKKLIPLLKKQHGSATPKLELPVLETILFAICLENHSVDDAQELFDRLKHSFCDLNEMRVSSITELVEVIGDDPEAEHRALRIRSLLQYVFESSFSYDLEQFIRKTQDQAQKFLNKIPHLSHFVHQFTLLQVLGAHVIPADADINQLAVWFGFTSVKSGEEKASDSLKSSVRKSEAALFFYLLRAASSDEKLMKKVIKEIEYSEGENFDLMDAPTRYTNLLAGKASKKKPVAKTTKVAAKTTKKATKKTTGKTAKKTVKKAIPPKPATNKPTKKTAAKTVKKKVVKAKKKTTPTKKSKKK
ncbi:hypothetical protein Pla110_16600 [Polystyrenella longa]|uniref:Uncharacterized protein n=1 Tax=Polystyrenella longa TaxID=2528007 RepID=A0A518CL42_9PLAN|nr:hypothetical protein [Polystyrenella longa]QDU79940.1 hypothetical protein Pla110_16600 [Polystyrenella longa]